MRLLLEELLLHASGPFLEMLQCWLFKGTFNDTEDEFMITAKGEDFELVTENAPKILKDLAQKILDIGVYRSILKRYGENENIAGLPLVYDRSRVASVILLVSQQVNRQMMNILKRDNNLFAHLLLVKHLYFLDHVDFAENLLGIGAQELAKVSKDVSVRALKDHLESAIGSSSLGHLLEIEQRVKCKLAPIPLIDQLLRIINSSFNPELKSVTNARGIDLISIELNVDFPSNLVLTSKNLSKYELIFRFQIALLDLYRQLQHGVALKPSKAINPLLQKLGIVRRCMFIFIQNIRHYLSYEVLEPRWLLFSKSIDQEGNEGGLDRIIGLHNDFIDTCLRECMLTNAKLVQLLSMVMSACGRFLSLQNEISRRIVH